MASILRSLTLSTRALSTRAILAAPTASSMFGAGQAILSPFSQVLGVTTLQQQIRGMKVHSSVKKRCEHCKVRQYCCYDLSQLGSSVWLTRLDIGCSTQGGQATQWLFVHYLQGEPTTQATTRIKRANKHAKNAVKQSYSEEHERLAAEDRTNQEEGG